LVAAQTEPQRLPVVSRNLFITLLLLIVGAAIVRSAIATRLGSFTIDEAYHSAAGVSYVRYADFRVNPEPSSVGQAVVGSVMSATGFHLSSIRPFADKADERDFTEQDVYFNNDLPDLPILDRVMPELNGIEVATILKAGPPEK
jgi:CheY-like chemotaxis protein